MGTQLELIVTADELIERLVAIIPRPHKNLILYTGVLAPVAVPQRRSDQVGQANRILISGI